MSVSRRYTVADLEQIEPVEGERYEVIDGELYVAHQPSWHHQYACTRLTVALGAWSDSTNLGACFQSPGVLFDAENGVAPDVVWISWARLRAGEDAAGHLHVAPELVVEVLSPGAVNRRRDLEIKLVLYSRQDVLEYWVVDWQQRALQVYRRAGPALALIETFAGEGPLTSPLLPGFQLDVARLWPPTAI